MTDPEPPLESRTVAGPEALKALTDPLRLRILELLALEPDRLWTVKELASELGQPPTKLYHHVKLLTAAELVRDAQTRIVSGIVEHRYRCAQRSIRLDDAVFGAGPETVRNAGALAEQARDALLAYLRRDDADQDEVMLLRVLVRLTAEERAEVVRRLQQVVDEVAAGRRRRRLPRTAVTIIVHPLAEAAPSSSD